MQELGLKDKKVNIIIVLMGALGDIARGIAIVEPIKNKYKDANIVWVTHKVWKPFVELHNGIDEILVFDKSLSGAINLKSELKNRKFDLCLDLQRNFKSGITSFLSGAKKRVGFNKKNTKEFNFLFNNHYINYFSEETPKLVNYLDFLRVLNIESSKDPNFGLSQFDFGNLIKEVDFNFNNDYLSIVLGSSWESKDWFLIGYQSLIEEALNNSKLNICLLGAGQQVNTGEKLKAIFSSDRVINLAGKTNLKQMVAVLKYSKVNIGPDSGPGHVSAALNVPYVSIFGPTNPSRVAPYNCEDLVIKSKLACSPCWKRKCPGLDRLCMRLVNGSMVWQKVRSIIN